MPFLRRRQESEPNPAAPEPAAAAPATPPPAEAPIVNEPLLPPPEVPAEAPVESQFRPVEGADEMLDMPLGTLIFRAGLIAPQQLEDALAEGLRSGKRLGEVLLSRGWLSEEDLSRLLAGQKGLPYADLDKIAIDRELAQAMSYDDAREEMALPVVSEFGVPVVAMADPDEAAMEALRAQLGPEVRFVVAAPSVLTRLIDEILGGAPAPGLLVAPTPVEQYSPDYLSSEPVMPEATPEAAPVNEPEVAPEAELETAPETAPDAAPDAAPEIAAEPEPVAPEAALVDSVEQEEAPVPEPEAQGFHPILAEGEVEYPTFSEYQPIPQPEMIGGPEEQLPEEVQMGDYGYYDDPSLLEGNAWRAGETGPPTEPPPEITDLTGAIDDAAPEIEQPLEAEQALEAEQPPEAEQPLEAEPTAEAWEEPAQESYPEATPESLEPEFEPPAPEQLPESPEESESTALGEEDLTPTPAWMRGEVNVITADVADFIDSAPSSTPESSIPQPVEGGDVAESESELVQGESEPLDSSAPESSESELEIAEVEAAEAEVAEPVEQAEAGTADEVFQEPAAAPASPETESAAGDEYGEFELVLRLVDGDRIDIGSFSSVEKAQERAGEVVKQFADAKEGGGWPLIGGRYLRPDTIVSIDVEQQHGSWGGSNSRGRMFSGDEKASPPGE